MNRIKQARPCDGLSRCALIPPSSSSLSLSLSGWLARSFARSFLPLSLLFFPLCFLRLLFSYRASTPRPRSLICVPFFFLLFYGSVWFGFPSGPRGSRVSLTHFGEAITMPRHHHLGGRPQWNYHTAGVRWRLLACLVVGSFWSVVAAVAAVHRGPLKLAGRWSAATDESKRLDEDPAVQWRLDCVW